MPDSTEVWRAAELLEDFKTIPSKLKILYEEAEVRLFVVEKNRYFYRIYDAKFLCKIMFNTIHVLLKHAHAICYMIFTAVKITLFMRKIVIFFLLLLKT